MEKIAELVKQLSEYKHHIISVNFNSDKPEIHLKDIVTLGTFSNYKAIPRADYKYPFEIYEILNGVKFFSIYRVEDFLYVHSA